MLFGRNCLYHTREVIVVAFVLCVCLALSVGLTLFKELHTTEPDGSSTASWGVYNLDGFLNVSVRVNTLDPAAYESRVNFRFTPTGIYAYAPKGGSADRLKGVVRLGRDCTVPADGDYPDNACTCKGYDPEQHDQQECRQAPAGSLRDGLKVDVDGKPVAIKEFESIPSRDQAITLESGQFSQYPFDEYSTTFTIQAFDNQATTDNTVDVQDVPQRVEVIAAVQSWNGTHAAQMQRTPQARHTKQREFCTVAATVDLISVSGTTDGSEGKDIPDYVVVSLTYRRAWTTKFFACFVFVMMWYACRSALLQLGLNWLFPGS
jgi:hypothetical protein